MSDRPAARHVSISRSGRFVAVAAPTGDALELVDALGAAPRVTIARPGGGDFACVGETLWLLDGATLRRVALDSGRALDPDVTLPAEGQRLRPIASDHEVGALVLGARTLAIAGSAGRLVIDDLDVERGATPWPIGGRRVLRAAPGGARIVEHDRGEVTRLAAIDGDVLEAAPLFGGRAIAALVRGDDDDDDDDAFVICRSDGGLIHRIAVPPIHLVAIADRRGIAIAVRADGALTTIDLRYGRNLADGAAPFTIGELAIDAAAQHVVLAGDDGAGPAVLHVPITDVFVATTATRRVVEAGAEPAPADAASAPAAAAASPRRARAGAAAGARARAARAGPADGGARRHRARRRGALSRRRRAPRRAARCGDRAGRARRRPGVELGAPQRARRRRPPVRPRGRRAPRARRRPRRRRGPRGAGPAARAHRARRAARAGHAGRRHAAAADRARAPARPDRGGHPGPGRRDRAGGARRGGPALRHPLQRREPLAV